ncbi:MAG: hypothetical protein JWN34_635 [Bryobacterales bacterium]|nr:hypothetical protein [Bryobacterales bacterium]
MQSTRRSKTRSLRSNSSTARRFGATFRALVCLLLFAFAAIAGGRGFRTLHRLEEQYARHGKDFGTIGVEEYVRMAQQLRDARPGKYILESKRSTGGGSKFDMRNNSFVSFDADGTIRSFFVPKDGIRFFQRQTTTSGRTVPAR